jgi:hypothetical protein
MSTINLIEEDLWDHYSGLPSPAWYQYNEELEEDEENSTDNLANIGSNTKKI